MMKQSSKLDYLPVEEDGHLKTALDAIKALITDKLDSKERTRFSSVANLCEVAQSLMRAEAKPRVPKDDVKYAGNFEEEDERNIIYAGAVGEMAVPIQYRDPHQQTRDLKIQMDSLSQVTIENQRAQMAAAEVQELKDLTVLLDTMSQADVESRRVFNGRIEQLVRSLKERNSNDNVVYSELSRGHSTRGSEPNGNLSEDVQPVERGTDGDGGLQEKGSERGFDS
jgi:hypothetical protein